MRVMLASAAAALIALASPLSHAQTATSGTASFVGTTKYKPGCPVLKIHIVRSDTALSGVVFFADGSGVSAVKGTTDGKKFDYTMTPINGKGPSGEIVGTISADGMITSKEVGTSCTFSAMVPRYADVLDRGG